MPDVVRVVLADDHALVLEGLRSLLGGQKGIRVVATATDGERLLDAVERFRPDVAVVDIRMPYMDGLTCLQRIREKHAGTKVLILTAYDDGQTLQSVMAARADGLVLKTDPPERTVSAIRQAADGQLVFPAAARRWLYDGRGAGPAALSERETEVLSLVAEGMGNAEVALRLHISENTVKFHLRNIYRRLDVSNRTEASRKFLERYT